MSRDDEVTVAEVTHTERVIVYADVATVAAQNPTDRARYPDLTDFEYVVAWVKDDPGEFVRNTVGDPAKWSVPF